MNIRYILIGLILTTSVSFLSAQDQRTFETKVADVLNLLPANNNETYKKTMQDLINMGPDVVDELVGLYQDSLGDQNAKLDFAISGIGKFLSSANESVQSSFAKAFVSNAQKNMRNEMAAALLEELVFFMPTDDLALLKPILQDRGLQMRALDILEMHPNKESGELVWGAMASADNRSRFKIYKILRDERFGKQNEVLNPSMANSQTELGQMILQGMAESGAPNFKDYFMELAMAQPDPIQIDALMKYTSSSAAKGHSTGSIEVLSAILDQKDSNKQLHALAVLELARVAPNRSIEAVQKAFSSSDEEIAIAAAHALDYLGESHFGQLVASIEKAPALAKAAAIRILTRKGWSGSIALVRSGLESPDSLVASQAVIGLAEMEGTTAQGEVLRFLGSADNAMAVQAAVAALRMSTDTKNINQVANILTGVDDDMQKQLIPLIAERGDNSYFSRVLKVAEQSEGAVQTEAIKALAKLGTAKDIESVLSLVNDLSGDALTTGQMTLDKMMNAGGTTNWESALLSAIEGNNKSKFIPLMGHLSGMKPHQLAKDILASNDDDIKNQLLTTMGEWADGSMTQTVIGMMDNPETYKNAFNAALGTIKRADWSDIRKILYLKKLHEYLKYPMDEVALIEEMSAFRNFYSLLTVGEYLENSTGSVQNAAAKGIMNIVMPGPQNDDGMTEPIAINRLIMARDIVSGTDSEYFKENINTYIASIDTNASEGFISMFNGENLDGWHGFVANPIQLSRMSEKEIAEKLVGANQRMNDHWWVEDGMIHFKGKGQNLVSDRNYRNFVMLVDWRIGEDGDSGIYLRGTPQVQIWDTARVDVGAQVGSGGLYNNQEHSSKPDKLADMAIGDWNHMKMVMMGEKVSVWLNGDLVVDQVVMENYWDRTIPIFPTGPVELQAHGTDIAFKNIYIKEIPSGEDKLTREEKEDGFKPLFNGYNLDDWTGNKTQYQVVNGVIVVDPEASGKSGNLYTEEQFDNFNFRFEFLLTPGANNGLGIHAPLSGDVAYGGKELQILDNTAAIYANLKPYQYHGSLYGIAPAKRGYLKPVGEWNSQEVIIDGDHYKVILNGTTILDVNVKKVTKNGTMDGKAHPGLKIKKGHIGFLGHGSEVRFRNIRIKEL